MSVVGRIPFHQAHNRIFQATIACGLFASATVARANPFADSVVSFSAGAGASPGFSDPTASLGSPARFTGVAAGYPGVVSMFNPPFDPDQIVSIGRGGQLTVHFDPPITNDPAHLFGSDLIIFGNTGFIDANYPNGQIGSPAGLFGTGNGRVEVSSDGVTYFPLSPLVDSLFPTQGYRDSAPYDTVAGSMPTDFFKPVNPSLTLSSFDGLTYAQAMSLYDGSGGGTPIDIAEAGLSSVSFVRVSIPSNGTGHAEIDAFAAVPEPAAAILVIVIGALALRRKRLASLNA